LAKDETSCAQYMPMFNDKNILILDDSISRGATIKNACNIIKDFSPKTITVLTMFFKKYRF
jgi:hypoxanthine-guanine phosphoribosyltransferase